MSPRILAHRTLTFLTAILLGVPGIAVAAAPSRPHSKRPPLTAEPSLDAQPLIKRLRQLENGPGILICEPVPVPGTETATANFGAGCSRWLNLVVGGHGEFGRTPLWDSVDHARKELKKPDLRLTLADARRLPAMLGVTHVVLGKVHGSSRRCSFTFEVRDLRKGNRVGPVLTITGTNNDVAKRLPAVARSISSILGVKAPRVPKAVGETAQELQQLGACPWKPTTELEPKAAGFLCRLAGTINEPGAGGRPERPYLATFLGLLYSASGKDLTTLNSLAGGLARQMPGNALVLGEIGRQSFRASGGPSNEARGPISTGLRQHPNSYLLRIASTYDLRLSNQMRLARAEVEMAVRCASRNPDAWLALSGTVGSQSQEIRRSRYVNQMSKQELDACQQFYADELIATLKAVSLDEQYALAWAEVCQAAAFLGAPDLAEQSFDRALALDPTDLHTLTWGLEFYQPKWQSNPAKLRKVGLAAVKGAAHLSANERVELAIRLHHADLPDLSARMLRSQGERQLVERHFRQHRD